MKEQVYNIFLPYAHGVCSAIAYVVHEVELNDAAAVAFLQARVETDYHNAAVFKLKKPFTHAEHAANSRIGQGHHLFDEFFEFIGASVSPLFVSTPVKDGRPYFDYNHNHNEQLDMADVARAIGECGVQVDWLVKYTSEKGIDIPQLIHDDYFLAIKTTYNAGLHVSAMKLLLSCIDSIAYIEYGNESRTPFIDWLNTYADLASLGINAEELWELRNGLLHMSNVSSHKVRANKVRRISFRVGGPSNYSRQEPDGIHYFHFYGLVVEFAAAQERWIATYNADRAKFAKFIERYDETISDSRVLLRDVSQESGNI